MSGPLSSNEIEDVVSSVRRLVSVDARPRPVSRDLSEDRLVLTPALRVIPETTAAPLILTAPVLDDAPDALAEVDPDPRQAAQTPDVASALQTFEAEWEEELWTEPGPPLAERALEAEEAEVVAEAPALPVGDDAPWADVADDWLADDVGPALAAKAAAAAAAEAEAVAAAHVAEPAERPGLRPSVLELSAADMLTDGDGNPLTVLDEAALQQIIRQLIHEELKGALGERITQNVRKLVRAEINRALAAHDLD